MLARRGSLGFWGAIWNQSEDISASKANHHQETQVFGFWRGGPYQRAENDKTTSPSNQTQDGGQVHDFLGSLSLQHPNS
jgi:hypothetical protein